MLCLRWNYLNFIWGVTAPTPYSPHQNTCIKGTSLGCQLAPQNDSCRPKLCCLSCTLVTSTPPKIPLPGGFGGACKTNKQKVVISYGWMLCRTNSRPSLHTRSKSVQDKCLKGCNVLATEKQTKHIFAAFARTHGTISPHFRASVHCCPTFIFQVSSKYVQVWGSYNQKCFLDPKVILI